MGIPNVRSDTATLYILESTEFDLGELVEGVAEQFAEPAQGKGLDFICAMAPSSSHASPDLGRIPGTRPILPTCLTAQVEDTEAAVTAAARTAAGPH